MTDTTSTLTFPPYTLTGGVAWRELAPKELPAIGDQCCDHADVDLEDSWGEVHKPGVIQVGLVYRRPLAPTPDNYRAMQTAWLSHFHVGVGSRVRFVRAWKPNELGFNWYFVPLLHELIGRELTVSSVLSSRIVIDGYWFPFHVLAPVEEQSVGEQLVEGFQQLADDLSSGKPIAATRVERNSDGTFTRTKGHIVHPHPPAVPEGQGKPFTCSDCGRGLIGRVPHTCRGNYRKKVRLTSDPASPTPAIKRGEEEKPKATYEKVFDEIRHNLRCVIVKNLISIHRDGFHYCGYVAVPKGNALHGADYSMAVEIEAHGGLTFSCSDEDFSPDSSGNGEWWFGFDCGHHFDMRGPQNLQATIREIDSLAQQLDRQSPTATADKPTPIPSAGQEEWITYACERLGGTGSLENRIEQALDREANLRTGIAGKDKKIERLRGAIRRAGFSIMETSGDWSIHDVSELAKEDERKTAEIISKNLDLELEVTTLTADLGKKEEELRRWKQSFDGHVYVPNGEYQTLVADLGRAREEIERRSLHIGRTADGVLLCDVKQSWCPKCKRPITSWDSIGADCSHCPSETNPRAQAWWSWSEVLGIDPSLRPAAKDDEGGGE